VRIAVIGSGYVGLITGACLAQVGNHVTCVDTDSERVTAMNRGEAPFYEPGLNEILSACIRAGRLHASGDTVRVVAESDLIFLSVGTPYRAGKSDLSYLSAAAEQVGKGLRNTQRYQTVIVKSTVVPGTTDNFVRPVLERVSGLCAGSFGLCTNPEFLREGSAVADFMNPDRIVIGRWDESSGARMAELYRVFDCPKLFTTTRNAEMIKYASNTLLATLISFSNELAMICEATPGTDVEEVLKAVHLDRRLSSGQDDLSPLGILAYLRAGCGFGGSCLPKDLSAIRDYARNHGIATNLLDGVAAVNGARPQQLLSLVEKALGYLPGRVVTILGLAFKTGTDDLRESPALAIASLLRQNGVTGRAYDPILSSRGNVNGIEVCANAEQALTGTDAAIVATAWPEFAAWDWLQLCALMRHPVLIDGRNALREVQIPPGATYLTIGKHFELQEALVGS
jgi:UDPglucose 6-dehydrogenase